MSALPSPASPGRPGTGGLPRRRDVLRGLGVLAASVTVSGCGLRWQPDAPGLPGRPHTFEQAIEALRAELAQVNAARSASATTDDAASLAVNTTTARALHARLSALGDQVAPVPVIEANPAPTPQQRNARAAAARACNRGLAGDQWPDLAGAQRPDALLLAASQVGRGVVAIRLGAAVPRWQDPAALATVADGDAAGAESLQALRERAHASRYALDIAAATTGTDRAKSAAASRAALAALITDLEVAAGAGASTRPPPQLGYPVPRPRDARAGAALAARTLGELSDTVVSAMAVSSGTARQADAPSDSNASATTAQTWQPWPQLRWRAIIIEYWAHEWRGGPRALPGVLIQE